MLSREVVHDTVREVQRETLHDTVRDWREVTVTTGGDTVRDWREVTRVVERTVHDTTWMRAEREEWREEAPPRGLQWWQWMGIGAGVMAALAITCKILIKKIKSKQ